MERWERQSTLVLQVFAFGLCAAMAANAADSRQVDLPTRTRGAHKVVVAKAVSVTPAWRTTEHGDRLIVSQVALQVEETFKGTSASSMWLEVEGGTIDGVTLAVSSLTPIKVGERAVFFLDETSSGVHLPHLKGMGILKLDTSNRIQGSSLNLDEVRRLVRSVR
jgi:hypothetical protein